MRRCPISLLLVSAIGVALTAAQPAVAGDWPQFRGTNAKGVASGPAPPVEWDVESGLNIEWKAEIPGLGHACPVISRGAVYVLTATSDNPDPSLKVGLYGDIAPVEDDSAHTWVLYCLSEQTGHVRWKRTVYEGVPEIKRHTKASHANSTPATDGSHVVVFLGSEGLFCYDVCGNLCWKKDFGTLDSGYFRVPEAQWGFASSPIIFRDRVIVQCDVQEDSFIAAFDICSGRELWRTPRDEVPTWSTPTVHSDGSRSVLIVNGYKHTGGYDPFTGRELWKLTGGGDIPVPTPVTAHGFVYLSSAHGADRPLSAIRLDATGDITAARDAETPGEPFAWHKPRDGIYMQTPLVYGDYLYACRGNGVLTCYDARSGEQLYRERLGQGRAFTASPVAAGGQVYFTSETGEVFVVKAGPEFELLERNRMGEICMATPAISDGRLIVRGKTHLYSIAEERTPQIVLTEDPQARTPVVCRPVRQCRPARRGFFGSITRGLFSGR